MPETMCQEEREIIILKAKQHFKRVTAEPGLEEGPLDALQFEMLWTRLEDALTHVAGSVVSAYTCSHFGEESDPDRNERLRAYIASDDNAAVRIVKFVMAEIMALPEWGK